MFFKSRQKVCICCAQVLYEYTIVDNKIRNYPLNSNTRMAVRRVAREIGCCVHRIVSAALVNMYYDAMDTCGPDQARAQECVVRSSNFTFLHYVWLRCAGVNNVFPFRVTAFVLTLKLVINWDCIGRTAVQRAGSLGQARSKWSIVVDCLWMYYFGVCLRQAPYFASTCLITDTADYIQRHFFALKHHY